MLLKMQCLYTKKKKYLTARNAIIAICILLGLLLRLMECIRFPVQPRDAYEYESIIREWEDNGEMPRQYKGPLSLWLLKSPHHFFGLDTIKGGVIVNNAIGILLMLIVMQEAFNFFKSDCIVLLVGMIMATHPQLIRFSCFFLRENSYLLFSVFFLGALARYCNCNRLGYIVKAAIMGALAFLCRQEGLEFLAIACIAIMLAGLFNGKKFFPSACHCVFFVLVFSLALAIVCHMMHFKIYGISEMMNSFDV